MWLPPWLPPPRPAPVGGRGIDLELSEDTFCLRTRSRPVPTPPHLPGRRRPSSSAGAGHRHGRRRRGSLIPDVDHPAPPPHPESAPGRRPSSSAGAGHRHGRRRRPSPAPVIIIRRRTCRASGTRIQYRFWPFSILKPRMERVSFRKGSEVSQGVSQHPPAPAPPPAPERLTSRPGPIPDVDHPRPLHIRNLPPGPLAAHGQGS